MADGISRTTEHERQKHVAKSDTNIDIWKNVAADLHGRACRIQPRQGQIPVLEAGKPTKSCNYKDLDANGSALGAVFREGQEHAVRFKLNLKEKDLHGTGSGSGVVIGKSQSDCYVATDFHVAYREGNIHVTKITSTIDGRDYPATRRIADEKHDLAVVAVHTGGDTDKVCKPATFAENPDQKGQGLLVGYPEDTTTLTASPAVLKGLTRFSKLADSGDPKEQDHEDKHRMVTNMRMRALEGDSGGGIYNMNKEAIALLYGGVKEDPNLGIGNPVSRKKVNDWLAVLAAQDEREQRKHLQQVKPDQPKPDQRR